MALPFFTHTTAMHFKPIILAALSAIAAMTVQAAELWVETESFPEKGGWVVDQQFTEQMGSTYLMAHGMGTPVADATTHIVVPEAGTYHVYARTFNWTSPWTSETGAGQFRIKIGSKTLKPVLGATGNKWEWQSAGTVKLKAGETTLSLCDLTGFNGRCDAIFLTTDPEAVLPDGGEALAAMRRAKLGLDKAEKPVQEFDFVVIGGGIAGMCAAVTAARSGLKVALVNDRPVLGGNNSSEIRVHLGGHIEMGPNPGLGRMIREFGHSKKGNAQPAANYEDEKKAAFIAAEPNVTLFPSYKAYAVETADNKIKSVDIRHIENANEITLTAPIFADCTGDGTVGVLAGADFVMGREGRDEFNESLAPEKADTLVMGASVQWYSKDWGKKTKFPEFNYGLDFNADNAERVTMGEWTWETGMNRNQITEAERVRDYGLMVVFSNWNFLKNHLKENEKFANRSLDWVAYMMGKRESRRLLGDYILKQDDIDKAVFHEDASFPTTWSIDLHFPDAKNTEKFPGQEFKSATIHNWIYPYAVPYRCLYSRNVDNLFMAGRNISVTHVALGTVRVMRTTGMMGEVVGMAASLCNKHGVMPRGVYQHHLPELTAMMKEGAGKPASTLPDNQHFNLANRFLETPKALKK